MGKMQVVLGVLVCAGLVIGRTAWAAQHVVGGSKGWDQSTDYDSWSSGETFQVGDQLVFKYSGLHSVVELGSETAYKNCDLGTTLNSMNSGNDVVKLAKPGTRYFACGTAGHCDQGMKVKVKVASAGAGGGPSSSPSPDSDSGSDPGSGLTSGSGSGLNSGSTGFGPPVSYGLGMVVGLIAAGLVWAF